MVADEYHHSEGTVNHSQVIVVRTLKKMINYTIVNRVKFKSKNSPITPIYPYLTDPLSAELPTLSGVP